MQLNLVYVAFKELSKLNWVKLTLKDWYYNIWHCYWLALGYYAGQWSFSNLVQYYLIALLFHIICDSKVFSWLVLAGAKWVRCVKIIAECVCLVQFLISCLRALDSTVFNDILGSARSRANHKCRSGDHWWVVQHADGCQAVGCQC